MTEVAVTDHFASCIQTTHAQGFSAVRIVVDEVHYIPTSKDFRPAMEKVWQIRSVACPLILISATIPVSMEPVLKRDFHLSDSTTVIWSPTNRPELEYILEPRGTCIDSLITRAHSIYSAASVDFGRDDRALVFVPTINHGKEIARALQCDFYNGSSEVKNAEREKMVTKWVSGVNTVMVCTSAFGAGNDYPHVRLIIHFGTPIEMIEYLQEAGRAGRDRNAARCYILPLDHRHPSVCASDPDVKGQSAMFRTLFESSDCLRLCFTRYIDGSMGVRCHSSPLNQACSRCREEQDHDLQCSLEPASADTPPRTPTQHLRKLTELPVPQPAPQPARPVPNLATKPAGPFPSRPQFQLRSTPLPGRVPMAALSSPFLPQSLSSSSPLPSPIATSSRGTKHPRNVFEELAGEVKRRKLTEAAQKAEYISRLKAALKVINGLCTPCLVRGSSSRSQHKNSSCPEFSFQSFGAFHKRIRYNSNTHGQNCTYCHIPQIDDTLHCHIDNTQQGQFWTQCPYPDCILPLIYTIFTVAECRAAAESFFGTRWTNIEGFAAWLSGIPLEGYTTNTMALFLWFTEHYCRDHDAATREG